MMAGILLLTIILIASLQLSLGRGLSADNSEFKHKLINPLNEINENHARADTSQCAKHMALYYAGVQSFEMWALNMLDSTAKLNSGILVGNVINMGDFDQCLSVEYNTGTAGLLKGQHCMVYSTVDLNDLPNVVGRQASMRSSDVYSEKMQHVGKLFNIQENSKDDPAQTLTLGFGICLPASCHGKELVEQLQVILSLANITMDTEKGYNSERYCSSKEPVRLSTGDWVAIVIFGVIGLCMVLSTLYELFNSGSTEGQKPRDNIYLAFSVISNSKRIFAIHPNPPDNVRSDNIPCIHGIRVLSILWVVMGHRYTKTPMFPISNPLDMVYWFTQYHSALIYGATIVVDTFFVLSGLLLAYSFMRQMTRIPKMNVPKMYFHRYLRLTPPLAAIVLFETTLISHIGAGPSWKQQPGDNLQYCIDYWWSVLLYVQNYVNPNEVCVPQSWYLSVDMQVYILSPILLYALWRYPKHAIGAGVILILINIGLVFGISYVNEFGGNVNTYEDWTLIYLPGHTRYGPMIMGMLLGYALFKTLKVKISFNKMLVVILWLGSFAVMLAAVFGLYPQNQVDHEKNITEAAFFKSLHRIGWSLAICWIIFACAVGYGGYINRFLSHPVWQPMSRLSYCLYLTHATIQYTFSGARKYPVHFSDLDMIYQFWGDLGLGTTAAVIWSLAFESPITIIEKVIFHPPKRATQKIAEVQQEKDNPENGHPHNNDSKI